MRKNEMLCHKLDAWLSLYRQGRGKIYRLEFRLAPDQLAEFEVDRHFKGVVHVYESE
jgi:hypothetical protein